MMLKRLITGVLLIAAFAAGLAVGAYDLPPYPQLRGAYAAIFPDERSTADTYSMTRVPVISAERYADLDTRAEIAMVGDSITASGRWDELFPEASIINRGVNGDVIGGLELRTDAILRAAPRKIFIMIGINDIAAGNSNAQIIARYRRVIDALKADGAQIYIQSVIPCRDFELGSCDGNQRRQAFALNRQLAGLARESDAQFIDVAASLADENGFLPLYSLDGVHPGSAGFAKWRRILEPHINGGIEPQR